MSSEINSVAKSRARYYCKGAPVQFVQVELLRIQENNNMIVTLAFKNIAPQILTAFTARFRCKGAGGAVVMEDDFTYSDLSVGEGELFGSDDAVFVSEQPLSSVEVSLVGVEYGPSLRHNLQRCQPVPLPALRPLSAQTAYAVNGLLQTDSAQYLPANVVDGWQCTCGAFNYNIGRGKDTCSECGVAKVPLLNAVRAALQQEGAQAEPSPAVPPQRAPAPAVAAAAAPPVAQQETWGEPEGYEALPESNDWNDPNELNGFSDLSGLGDMDDALPASASIGDTAQYENLTDYSDGGPTGRYDDNAKTAVIPSQRAAAGAGVSLMQTETADFILKFAPFITLGASAVYVTAMLLINMLL